jgi:hypothetical protein
VTQQRLHCKPRGEPPRLRVEPPWLHCEPLKLQGEPPWLHCEPQQLLGTGMPSRQCDPQDPRPDPAPHFDADPDPAFTLMRIRPPRMIWILIQICNILYVLGSSNDGWFKLSSDFIFNFNIRRVKYIYRSLFYVSPSKPRKYFMFY